ncbi:MAG: hypothetical protein WBV80_05270 [Mycobacterium sp.]
MSSFESAVILLPLALFAGGMQNLLAWPDYEQRLSQARQQISAASDDGVVLRARHIGCGLPDTTLIRLTPAQVRILVAPRR